MENDKKITNLGVSDQLKAGEKLGSKVAKITNKARAVCNKLLEPLGYGVDLKAEFYRLGDHQVHKETNEKEEVNG